MISKYAEVEVGQLFFVGTECVPHITMEWDLAIRGDVAVRLLVSVEEGLYWRAYTFRDAHGNEVIVQQPKSRLDRIRAKNASAEQRAAFVAARLTNG